MSIELSKNPDILKSLGDQKKKNQILVGFALETDNEESNAQGKLKNKNADFIVLNSLKDKGAGFGHDTNKVSIVSKDSIEALPLMSKTELADILIQRLSSKIS